MSRAVAERRGRRGEGFASLWLRLQGWRVLARRVKTPRGEIDLIARRGRTVAFVEVKWRASAAERDMAIDAYRLRRVAAAVEAAAHHFLRPLAAPHRQCLAALRIVDRLSTSLETSG